MIQEFYGQVDWIDNPGDLKRKRPKVCTIINPLVDPEVQEFELEEISTGPVVYFETSRGRIQ